MRAAVLILLVACGGDRPRDEDLAGYLARVAALEPAARTAEVRSWQPDEATWRRIVVAPYGDVYADYARAFAARVPAIADRLRGPFATRAHYAGDPELTAGEAETRWALPVAFASQVAANPADLDVVFVRDGGRWLAISGVDAVIRARVSALDATCAGWLDVAGPSGRCREIAFEIADSALRTDRARFAHACHLATTLCGKPAP